MSNNLTKLKHDRMYEASIAFAKAKEAGLVETVAPSINLKEIDMAFTDKWVGSVFKCTKTGCVKVLTPDIVKPRKFISIGECCMDLGDGFYVRRSKELVEVKGLEKAKVLAQHAHQGQKYGIHDYFEYHVLGVMMMLDSITANEDVSCVAILHDSIEDTWITEEVIRHQFNDQVADAVVALTKESRYDYEDYVNRIRSNPIALLVKTVDAKFNLAESEKEGDKRRVRKYNKLLNDLGGVCVSNSVKYKIEEKVYLSGRKEYVAHKWDALSDKYYPTDLAADNLAYLEAMIMDRILESRVLLPEVYEFEK